MKRTFLFLLLLCFMACQKKIASTSQPNPPITQAHNFFSGLLAKKLSPNSENFRANQVRDPAWDQAKVLTLSIGPAVIVPVNFENRLFVRTTLAPSNLLDLSLLTKLVIFRDSTGQFSYQILTLIPDSNAIANNNIFSGIVLSEDWSGNSLTSPQRTGQPQTVSATSPRPIIADDFAISTCSDIDGYNYAVGDAENGETWEETSCTLYSFGGESDGSYSSFTGTDYSDVGGGGGGAASTIQIAPPTNHIASVADYFNCFTNVGGSDHTYTVTLAVQQPVPGTRDTWTIASGGPTGSTQASNIFNVGHTFLILSETYGNTTITRNIGFYPTLTVRPSSPSSGGEFSDDENHQYNISGSYTVNNAQFYDMLNFIISVNNSSYLYNLNSNNCSTFAINTFAQAGINLPRTVGTWPGGSGNDPGDLGEDIRTGNIPNMSVSTAPSANHGNVGECN
jgi:hypothetical protein